MILAGYSFPKLMLKTNQKRQKQMVNYATNYFNYHPTL